jgi:hypothetical protein
MVEINLEFWKAARSYLCCFAEGNYHSDYYLLPFKPKAFVLLMQTT